LRIRIKVGYNQHVNVVASEGLAKDSFAYLVLVLEAAPLLYIFHQICVGVRVAVGKEHRIVIVLKFELEGQRVVQGPVPSILLETALGGASGGHCTERGVGRVGIESLFLFTGGLIVCNIETVAMPPNFMILCVLLTVDKWPHSLVVVGVGFH